jgi:hypothetical protein
VSTLWRIFCMCTGLPSRLFRRIAPQRVCSGILFTATALLSLGGCRTLGSCLVFDRKLNRVSTKRLDTQDALLCSVHPEHKYR